MVGLNGKSFVIDHEGMEYNRQLTTDATSVTENLLVSVAQVDNSASINIYIGVPLNVKDLKVLAAS